MKNSMRSLACPARRIKLLPSASSSVSFQRSRSSMYRAPRFERGGCRRESCREYQFTGMWLNPNSRGSRLRIWQPWGCNSLHAHHLRRLASEGTADPSDLRSLSLPGASPGAPTGVWLIGIADRFGSNPNSLGSASLPTPTNLECQPDERAGPVC